MSEPLYAVLSSKSIEKQTLEVLERIDAKLQLLLNTRAAPAEASWPAKAQEAKKPKLRDR